MYVGRHRDDEDGETTMSTRSSEQRKGRSESRTGSGTRQGDTADMTGAKSGEPSSAMLKGRDRDPGSTPDISEQLARIAADQKQIMSNIKTNHRELKQLIADEIGKVREDLNIEVAKINRRLDVLETRAPPPVHEPFEPGVTVVVANLPSSSQEDPNQLMTGVQGLIHQGMGLPGIEIVAVTRRAARGRGPGLVLVELHDLEDKKTVLRAKRSLREKPEYRNIYVRSAEGHTDRLLRLNFQTLLNHFQLTQQFRFTGSGRLIPRETTTPRGSQPEEPETNDDERDH